MTDRYRADDLRAFATALFTHAGMEPDKAAVVAEVLVEGDLLGHDTHGLAHLPPYLDALARGEMTGAGEPELLSYPYLPAARADFLRRLGRAGPAAEAYREALLLTDNAVEADYLRRRLAAVGEAP